MAMRRPPRIRPPRVTRDDLGGVIDAEVRPVARRYRAQAAEAYPGNSLTSWPDWPPLVPSNVSSTRPTPD
jgi:hypothetical protein